GAPGRAGAAHSVRLFEVAGEVTREDAVERAVREGEGERVALDERRIRQAFARDPDHRVALVEPDHLPAEMLRQEARAAGDIERPRGREIGDPALEQLDPLLVPSGTALLAVQPAAEPPVVVLARPCVL